MPVQLHVDFGKTVRLEDLPPRSIALDGYVRGPAMDLANERFSFDHHDNCIRHVTAASCVQVLDALAVGFDPDGFDVYVNDIDADTVLSVYLLESPPRAQIPFVRELIEWVGKVDSHGPAYILGNHAAETAHRYLELVLMPEREARKNGTYGAESMRELLDECLRRTDNFVHGRLDLGTPLAPAPYTVVFEEQDLVMIRGDREMMGQAYRDGWNKVIALLPAKNDSTAYTIAKKSEFVRFDVPGLLRALHDAEPGWGGGSTVGGSPRNPDGTRSKMTPEEVWRIARGFL